MHPLTPQKSMVVIAPHPDHVLPLIKIEPQVIKVITQVARLRLCLTPSQAVQLINSMIEGTDAQKKLIEWKNIILLARKAQSG